MRGECNLQRPSTLLLGGPQPDVERVTLAFTPAFPCGMESNTLQTIVTPLRRVLMFQGCVGRSCPGDLVVVHGRVQAMDFTTPAGADAVRGPLSMDDCAANVQRSQPRVKLEIASCGLATRLIVDSDSSVVIPSGQVTIHALVPGPNPLDGSFNNGGWQEYGSLLVPGETPWTDTRVEVWACPATSCCPCGILSEYFDNDTGLTAVQRMLLRPRGARKLYFAAAGAATNANIDMLRELDAASVIASETSGIGARFPVELYGDSPALVVAPADQTVSLRWEICGP